MLIRIKVCARKTLLNGWEKGDTLTAIRDTDKHVTRVTGGNGTVWTFHSNQTFNEMFSAECV